MGEMVRAQDRAWGVVAHQAAAVQRLKVQVSRAGGVGQADKLFSCEWPAIPLPKDGGRLLKWLGAALPHLPVSRQREGGQIGMSERCYGGHRGKQRLSLQEGGHGI